MANVLELDQMTIIMCCIVVLTLLFGDYSQPHQRPEWWFHAIQKYQEEPPPTLPTYSLGLFEEEKKLFMFSFFTSYFISNLIPLHLPSINLAFQTPDSRQNPFQLTCGILVGSPHIILICLIPTHST